MFTPERIAKMRQKEASTPEALRRDPLTNYTEGWFFVTLNTRDDVPVLSTVKGRLDAPDNTNDAPRCEYTEIGKRVKKIWQTIPDFHPQVEVHDCEVMPEHFHGLLYIHPGGKEHLGQVINGFMIGCTHEYWDTLGIPWRSMTKDATASLSKEADRRARAKYQDRDHTHSKRGPALFVHGYNDAVPITDEEVQVRRQYIRDQARKRLLRGDRHECFRIHRDMQSQNWTPQRVMRGLCRDCWIAADHQKQVVAWQALTATGACTQRGKVCHKLKFKTPTPSSTPAAPPTLCLDLVGNMELLQRPLLPLVCHRADALRFDEQKAAMLKAAHDGAVIVTACVSPKEREVMKALQRELLPVIEVMGNGFSERYKPVGKAFYAVAERRRLEVSPWQYEYRRRDLHPILDADGNPVLDADGQPLMEEIPDITREECMAMNEVVRVICKRDDDDWWKASQQENQRT